METLPQKWNGHEKGMTESQSGDKQIRCNWDCLGWYCKQVRLKIQVVAFVR